MTDNNDSDSINILVVSDSYTIRDKISTAAQQSSTPQEPINVKPAFSIDDAKMQKNSAENNDIPYDAIIVANPTTGDKQAATRAIKEGEFDDLPTIMVVEEGQRVYKGTEDKINGTLPISSKNSAPLDPVLFEEVIRNALAALQEEKVTTKQTEDILAQILADQDLSGLEGISLTESPTSSALKKVITKKQEAEKPRPTEKTAQSHTDRYKRSKENTPNNGQGTSI